MTPPDAPIEPSSRPFVFDGICPVCGHCGMGVECPNCRMRGREPVLLRQRTWEDVEYGVPDPLFYMGADGGTVPR